MKKLVFCLLALACLTLQAQTDGVQSQKQKKSSFLTEDQMPDATMYLPAPPAFGSELFVSDMLWHQWGRSQRDTPRGQQARREADTSLEAILQLFSGSFGTELSPEKTPEVTRLVECVMNDGYTAVSKAKRHYNRQRPFLHFNEGTLVPEDEDSHHTPSFPSSHTAMGWTVALVLVELNPIRAEHILKTGYEYGQSRIIAGYHYKSDVEAARLAASACVARLHADEAFQKQMTKAKREVENLHIY